MPQLHTRKLTIIAQDPSVRVKGKILRTEVEIPAEELQPGPWGYRVHTVDYDSSTETLYKPLDYPPLDGANSDPFKSASDAPTGLRLRVTREFFVVQKYTLLWGHRRLRAGLSNACDRSGANNCWGL